MSTYARHLSELQEKTKVVATEDIFSDRGVLIVKSGAEINKKAFGSIMKFKLMKPLEDSIFIANQLNPKAIYDQITDLIARDPYLKALNQELGNAKVLQKCCLHIEKYPLLLQKLTVLDMEITQIFHQSLLSAYMCYIFGMLEKAPQQQIQLNFLSGLIHDIGLLHIDRYIITKQETLTADEWRKVQSHPVIGYEILKRIPGFPAEVARSVLEHHENLDGSGYPRGKTIHDLSRFGQMINLLDTVIVVYNKKFKPLKRSPRDIIPIVQMTMHSYLPEVVSVIFQILKAAPASPVAEDQCELLEDLIGHIQSQQSYINKVTQRILEANDAINFTHEIKELYAIQNLAINILVIINSSGLNDEANLDWSQQLADQQNQTALYLELEDTRLIQEEIIYQLNGYQKSINVFLSRNPESEYTEELQKTLNVFSDTHRPSVPDKLKDYWQQLMK